MKQGLTAWTTSRALPRSSRTAMWRVFFSASRRISEAPPAPKALGLRLLHDSMTAPLAAATSIRSASRKLRTRASSSAARAVRSLPSAASSVSAQSWSRARSTTSGKTSASMPRSAARETRSSSPRPVSTESALRYVCHSPGPDGSAARTARARAASSSVPPRAGNSFSRRPSSNIAASRAEVSVHRAARRSTASHQSAREPRTAWTCSPAYPWSVSAPCARRSATAPRSLLSAVSSAIRAALARALSSAANPSAPPGR